VVIVSAGGVFLDHEALTVCADCQGFVIKGAGADAGPEALRIAAWLGINPAKSRTWHKAVRRSRHTSARSRV